MRAPLGLRPRWALLNRRIGVPVLFIVRSISTTDMATLWARNLVSASALDALCADLRSKGTKAEDAEDEARALFIAERRLNRRTYSRTTCEFRAWQLVRPGDAVQVSGRVWICMPEVRV